jgi:hypothetical protein
MTESEIVAGDVRGYKFGDILFLTYPFKSAMYVMNVLNFIALMTPVRAEPVV